MHESNASLLGQLLLFVFSKKMNLPDIINAIYPHFNQQYIMQIQIKNWQNHFASVLGWLEKSCPKKPLREKGRKSETGQTQLTSPDMTTTLNIHCINTLRLSSAKNNKIREQLNCSKSAFDALKRSSTVCLIYLLFEEGRFHPVCIFIRSPGIRL